MIDDKAAIEVRLSNDRSRTWEVARTGDAGAISVHLKQRDAISAAKLLAKQEQAQLVLRGRDGKVQAVSFGNVTRRKNL